MELSYYYQCNGWDCHNKTLVVFDEETDTLKCEDCGRILRILYTKPASDDVIKSGLEWLKNIFNAQPDWDHEALDVFIQVVAKRLGFD